MAYCMNCGKELPDGAKFCAECGTAVNAAASGNSNQRKTVYDGEIHKCPNCGDILDAYESVCKTCGYERRGTKVTSSVQELARKLEAIESQRPTKKATSVFTLAFSQGHLSTTDEQKINIIQSFPIPNSKEDIMEFAVLAISNIDPDAFSTWNNPAPYNTTPKRAISSAWMSKFEQAYQKGRLMFRDSPELENMHSLYLAKKKSIRIKKNGIWIGLGILYGIIGLIFGIIALAGGFS